MRGEPARALKTLPVSDSNYDAAWELLRKRYEDTNEFPTIRVRYSPSELCARNQRTS